MLLMGIVTQLTSTQWCLVYTEAVRHLNKSTKLEVIDSCHRPCHPPGLSWLVNGVALTTLTTSAVGRLRFQIENNNTNPWIILSLVICVFINSPTHPLSHPLTLYLTHSLPHHLFEFPGILDIKILYS